MWIREIGAGGWTVLGILGFMLGIGLWTVGEVVVEWLATGSL